MMDITHSIQERVVYMRKKELFDALNEMYEKSKELRQQKLGWGEFRARIDKTWIILQHGFINLSNFAVISI